MSAKKIFSNRPEDSSNRYKNVLPPPSRRFVFLMKHLLLALFLSALITLPAAAQNAAVANDSSSWDKVGILPVPAFGYAPETDIYFGAVTLFTLKFYPEKTTRTSNAKVEFNYSLKHQIIFETGWNYFFNREDWFSRGNLHFSKYPDLYYGVGEKTVAADEVNFSSNRLLVQLDLLKQVADKMFLGPAFRYMSYTKFKYLDGNRRRYDELNASSLWGAGFTLLQDSRNNMLNATAGYYAELSYFLNRINENYYGKINLDFRAYKSFQQHTFAVRFLNESASARPPFYDYAFLGGDKRVRGYYYGRYRDKNLLTFQAEYRSPLLWRVGLACFGGFSKTYEKMSSPTMNDPKTNYGMGLRFLIDKEEHINFRLDYAKGESGQDGFYVAFGESF